MMSYRGYRGAAPPETTLSGETTSLSPGEVAPPLSPVPLPAVPLPPEPLPPEPLLPPSLLPVTRPTKIGETSLCPGGIYACAEIVEDREVQNTFNAAVRGTWHFSDMVNRHLEPIRSNSLYNESNGWIIDKAELEEACSIWNNTAEIDPGMYCLTNTAGVVVNHAISMETMPNGRLVAQKGKYFEAGDFTVALVNTKAPDTGLHVKQAFVAHRTGKHQDAADVATVIRENWKNPENMDSYDKAQLCPEVKDKELDKINLLGPLVGVYSEHGYTTGEASQKIRVTFDKLGSITVAVTQIIAYRSLSAPPKSIDLPGELSLMYYIDTAEGPRFIMCVALPNTLSTSASNADGSGPVPVPPPSVPFRSLRPPTYSIYAREMWPGIG